MFTICTLAIIFLFNRSVNCIHLFNHDIHVPGEPLSPIDYHNAEMLPKTSYNVNNGPNQRDPIELAGLFEGDIILDPEDTFHHNNDSHRNAVNKEVQKWPGGIIPYIISAQFNPLERSVLARAFLDYQRQTCIKFIPRTTEVDYVHIMKGNGCSSHVGKTGGEQPVILGNGCCYVGIATHELMHAIGFWHEQSRWDRDEYVDVYPVNIAPGMDFNFRKYSWRDIQNLSAPYDTGSILHYGPTAFAKDKSKPTIVPKVQNDRMGQRDALSKVDIWKIQTLYNCGGSQPQTSNPTSPPPANSSPSEGKCIDTHKHCMTWSERGECTKNPTWMKVNCKKSCNNCDAPCTDSNQYCSIWQQGGECSRNPHYMNIYCPKSCGVCMSDETGDFDVSTPSPSSPILNKDCKDDEESCEQLANEGECSTNPNYMINHCRKSCNICFTNLVKGRRNSWGNDNEISSHY